MKDNIPNIVSDDNGFNLKLSIVLYKTNFNTNFNYFDNKIELSCKSIISAY